jgi:hypothetical protein
MSTISSTRHVTCISKDGGYHANPHKAISHLGFTDSSGSYRTTRLEMYNFIEAGGSAYVKDRFGNTVYIGTAIHEGTKYVRTYADGKWTDNLLALPECVG